MARNDCLFCKIIAGETPSTKVMETDNLLVIKDIHPQAPTHLLILPKKHIENLVTITDADRDIVADLFTMPQKIARALKISTEGFTLVVRNGRQAGQEIDHLHVHFMSKKKINQES